MPYREAPTGVMDGANRIFRLALMPSADGPVLLYRNNVQLTPCPPSAPVSCIGDYQIGGNVILFMLGHEPNPGEEFFAIYWHDVTQ